MRVAVARRHCLVRRYAITMAMQPPIRFGVIGINHNHIYGQVNLLLRAGAEFVSFFAPEPDLREPFAQRFDQAREARSAEEVLEDETIDLLVTAAIPDQRAPLAIAAMRHGKDVMTDKPGCVSLAQLAEVRAAQAETHQIYSVCYSERFENAATVRAGELVRAGAVGRPLQTIGLGPHRMNLPSRPEWFFDAKRYGGIIADIGSHQADQFLYFTGSSSAEVVAAQAANYAHPEYPAFEDFGHVMLQGNGGAGYIRLDWFTPNGLDSWGDTRLTVLGTDGYIEVRKNIDIAGRPGPNHLFLVDGRGTHYINCQDVPLPYGPHLVGDVLNRTETAMLQKHCFLATELALRAQAQATRLGHLQQEGKKA